MVGCDGKLKMVHYKICNEFHGREKLLVHKSMEVGGSARLHVLDSLWGNILCLLTINMPRMNICGLVGGKNNIAEMVIGFGEANEKKRKFIQFLAIF